MTPSASAAPDEPAREDAAAIAPRPASWTDYVSLMKPRVMSLVVFTAVTGLLAPGTPVNPILGAVAILCVTVGAGASAAFNMAWEADIDAVMRRTRARPVAAGRVRSGDAAGYGGVMALFSVMVMGLGVNWLAAGLLAFTIFFYAVVYTRWLKRSTPQNIVIGGLAGALPPVIGWAAATGEAPLNAWLLCGLIFLWTPPHFWALSLAVKTDYDRAGVPMMPVVKGAASTRRQILGYAVVMALFALAPLFTGLGGWAYGAAALLGGIVFVALAVMVARSRAGEGELDKAPARRLFAFSIFYLFALFAALILERFAPILRLS